jgi:predicted RNase H-like HicB family nuclease
MKYVYPAVFQALENGLYYVDFPDLPGCATQGKDLSDALFMAQDALNQWLGYLEDKQQTIPAASAANALKVGKDSFINLVNAETKDRRAVRRNVSIPKWMDEQVTKQGLSLSRVVQDALSNRFSGA